MPTDITPIVHAEAGFEASGATAESQPYFALASLAVPANEASDIVQDLRKVHKFACTAESLRMLFEQDAGPRIVRDALERLRGRFKQTSYDKRSVLIDIFRQRILVPALMSGDVVPFVLDPAGDFERILLKRMVNSDKPVPALAEEMEDFLVILHDLRAAPTLFGKTGSLDDTAIARIMAVVDHRWTNIRGEHSIGPDETIPELLVVRLCHGAASRHLTAWIDRHTIIHPTFDGESPLRAVAKTFSAPEDWTRALPDHLADPSRYKATTLPDGIVLAMRDEPATFLAKLVATAAVAARSRQTDPDFADITRLLDQHRVVDALEVEPDSLRAFVERTRFRHAAVTDSVIEPDAEELYDPGFVAGSTWLDQYAVKARNEIATGRLERTNNDDATLRLALKSLAQLENDTALDEPAEARKRFDADLAALVAPQFKDRAYALSLSPGFSRRLDGRRLSDREVSAMLIHFAERPFTYIDCPTGSYEIGDGIEIRAIYARFEEISNATALESVSTGHLVVAAVIGRAGTFPNQFLSWRFASDKVIEVEAEVGKPSTGNSPFALIRESGRTVEGLIRDVETTIAEAVQEAKREPRRRPLQRLYRFEHGDRGFWADEHNPHRTMLNVVQLSPLERMRGSEETSDVSAGSQIMSASGSVSL